METQAKSPGTRLARQIIVDVAVLIAIGAVLGLLAPLGTGYMSFPGRMAYWVTMAVAGYLFYRPIGAIVLGLGPRLDLPDWFLWCAAIAIATVPMATLVWFVNHGFRPVAPPSFDIALIHYLAVLVVGAVVTLAFNLLPATRAVQGTSAPQPPAPEPVPPEPVSPEPVSPEHAGAGQPAAETPSAPPFAQAPFLDRLPAHLGSDLIALEMEDHYVRAHTALGSELILLRMRDAVGELGGVEGAQVHRSWWVARDAVEDVKRDGRNLRLVLANGLEAPVSRTRVAELKQAGWL